MKATIDEIKIEHLSDENAEPVEVPGNARMGVRAVATVRVHLDSIPEGHVLIQTLSTGGLWGIEVADPLDGPDKAFLGEVEVEQLEEMREILAAFGLRGAGEDEPQEGNARRAMFGGRGVDVGSPDRGGNDDRTDAGDTIANVLHWLDSIGDEEPLSILDTARNHYEAEKIDEAA